MINPLIKVCTIGFYDNIDDCCGPEFEDTVITSLQQYLVQKHFLALSRPSYKYTTPPSLKLEPSKINQITNIYFGKEQVFLGIIKASQ